MKVFLVKPPIRGCMVEIGRHVPIGLAYVSGALRAAGHETELFDSLAYDEDNHVVPEAELTPIERAKLDRHPRWRHIMHWGAKMERIEAAMAASGADVVGISCMFTPYYETAYELARMAKRVLPNAKVVLGGQHGTVAFQHVLQVPEIDVVMLGEAEVSTVDLMEAFATGRPLTELLSVAFRCGEGLCDCATAGAPHIRPRAPFVADLDALAPPAADQLDFARYGNAVTLITSRGCPFSCSFCTVHATVGKQFRARDPERVVDEIEHYVRVHGVRRFLVEDDNFTFDIERVHAICQEIVRRELDIRLSLPNGMTVVKLTEDLVESMVSAGFDDLFLGLETTDAARLRKMRKGFTSLDKVSAGVALFEKFGLRASAAIIVGLPDQTLDAIVQDAVNLTLAGVEFWTNPFYPIYGSPDYQTCLTRGIVDPLTDPAFFDQFNFAFANGVLEADELYTAWVGTLAMALWPGYVLEGEERRRQGPVSVAEAGARLVEHSMAQLDPDDPEELPATVRAVRETADGLLALGHPQGCVCVMQHVADVVKGAGADQFCRFAGDMIAAAIALYSGVPQVSAQVGAQTAGDTEGCSFLVRPTEDERIGRIQRRFVELLDQGRRESEMVGAEAVVG
ncbi:B12-binding domain-containing radical SAM protein [Micromonospora sp. NPDC048830]|uniref:B12-binding domain-containing radical SAM protein n=1 Tax=Micromonospora sp. NPDC048830 TaxID=3364257 RepID=UPI00371C2452